MAARLPEVCPNGSLSEVIVTLARRFNQKKIEGRRYILKGFQPGGKGKSEKRGLNGVKKGNESGMLIDTSDEGQRLSQEQGSNSLASTPPVVGRSPQAQTSNSNQTPAGSPTRSALSSRVDRVEKVARQVAVRGEAQELDSSKKLPLTKLRSHFIPITKKREVFREAGFCCEFRDGGTGRRCDPPTSSRSSIFAPSLLQ